jgi:hypothetical protein
VSSSPTAHELERVLALRDPDLVEASHEVDRTLLRWSLELTPLERLRACTRTATTLELLRGALAR